MDFYARHLTEFYTFGYGGWTLKGSQARRVNLNDWAVRNNALIADVRLEPKSGQFIWGGGALRKLLGDRYAHIPNLGNLNFRSPEQGIEIADFNMGIPEMFVAADGRDAVVILCACENYETCHRKEIAERLKLLGIECRELEL